MRTRVEDVTRGLDAVHACHLQVHEDHVRLERGGKSHHLFPLVASPATSMSESMRAVRAFPPETVCDRRRRLRLSGSAVTAMRQSAGDSAPLANLVDGCAGADGDVGSAASRLALGAKEPETIDGRAMGHAAPGYKGATSLPAAAIVRLGSSAVNATRAASSRGSPFADFDASGRAAPVPGLTACSFSL